MHSINIKSSISNYDVYFYDSIKETLDKLSNFVVVVDANVYDLYKDYIPKNSILFDCVEQNKTLEGASFIYKELIKRKVKSNGKLAIIGGGILQDVAGFVASTYCRGIEYHLVPTTLLAQCDSCIGGKTSINFESVKNILGTFYPPKEIHICTEFLKTLTEKDYFSGMGEIVKFNILKNTTDKITENHGIKDLIIDSLTFKSSIIQVDEFDKKERKFLNFGHTFGHALESTSNYEIPHGTAVLIGILIANKVAVFSGPLSLKYESKLFDVIYPFIKHQRLDQNWFNFSDLMSIVNHDKKNTGVLNMVLMTNRDCDLCPIIRPVQQNETFQQDILETAIKSVYETIRLRN